MIATVVNCLAVILGALLGIALGSRIQTKYQEVVFNGAGITTIVIGLSMALQCQNIIYLALALIAGGLIGTRLDIEGAILSLGDFLEKLSRSGRRRPANSRVDATSLTDSASSAGSGDSPQKATVSRNQWNFAYGFLNASVLFCVGAMALVGSFRAGTEADYSLILTKSVLDGFMAILMGAALGPGVAFSALPILLYQGSLTLGATGLKPFVSDLMLTELTGTGGALIVMIGFNLLALKKFKTADFLPALIFTIMFVIAHPWFGQIALWFSR